MLLEDPIIHHDLDDSLIRQVSMEHLSVLGPDLGAGKKQREAFCSHVAYIPGEGSNKKVRHKCM